MTKEMILELAGKDIRVEYFYNRGTNPVANQVAIINRDEITFFSYNSKICILKAGKIIFLDKWDCSNTTSKYFKKFLDRFSLEEYKDKKTFEKFVDENFAYNKDVKGMLRITIN